MAIAIDTGADLGQCDPCSSLTTAYTVTGTNPAIVVATVGDSSADDLSSITYAGVALDGTNKVKVTDDRWQYMRVKGACATGENDVVITYGSAHVIRGLAVSYTGCSPVQPDVSGTNASTTDQPQGTLISIADNCWHVGHARDGGVLTAGAGTTDRASNGFSKLSDNNAAITPPGGNTIAWTGAVGAWAVNEFTIAPFVATTTRKNNMILMGVT